MTPTILFVVKAIPIPAPIPASSPVPGGPLVRYLQNPGHVLHDLLLHVQRWATGPGLITAPALLIAGVLLVAARRWWFARRQRQLADGAQIVTVLPPPEVDPAGAVAFWANLVGLLRPAWRRHLSGQPHIAFEYAITAEQLQIQLWIPGTVPVGMVQRAIEAAWPGARTTTQPATDPSNSVSSVELVAMGGELRLGRSEALPIRAEHPADPLRALFGAVTGLARGQSAVVQILARPVTGRRVTRARRDARTLAAGRSSTPTGRVLDLLTPRLTTQVASAGKTRAVDRVTALEDTARDRAVALKQRGALFETRVRYTLTAPAPTDRTERADVTDALRGRGHAIASAFAAFTDHNYYRRRSLRHPDRVIASRALRRGDLLSIPELAALAHLPTDTALPGMARAGARALPPPPGVPARGEGIKPLGVADAGPARPVGLAVADARQHVHLLGATGSGKSTLMARLILADAAAGRGVVVIDPKGDLVTDIHHHLPTQARDRLVLFDADAPGTPPCLNPLDTSSVHGDSQVGDNTVDNLTAVFARVYAAFWGPRIDDVFRAALLTLRVQSEVATLADVPKLLTDAKFRAQATATLTDPVLHGFWTGYEHLSDAARAQVIAPLMNKLRAFLLRPFVRDALAAGPATVNLAQVIDEGGICLVRIPKGAFGTDTTRLIGSLVVAGVWHAATARSRLPEHERSDAGLYLDECQNFLNLPYALEDLLAEARGYRLSLVLAHQNLVQLGRDLREGISSNARNKIYFATGPDDARDLARHTAPHLTDHDLANLDAYHAAARLVVNGAPTRAFTFRTDPLPQSGGQRRVTRDPLSFVGGLR